ncbi:MULTISPECIES: glycosyltransferase [Halomonas]|uniref:glycosyltransferase n=1 Tax=Halomonas TaxID=2745 RepID=UPI001866E3D4|nr:glycosyltransferase [Halomonas citrativorans]
MYFVGVTRFSLFLPGSGAWLLSKTSEDDYVKSLFSDERLSTRFNIFFKKAVPIYQKMAEKYDYNHVIQYSSLMPEKWKVRLFEESRKYDFIILSESGKELQPIPILEILKDRPAGSLALFRVDDDDILPSSYLDNLSRYNNENFEGMIISFGRGLAASYYSGGFIDFRECHRRFLALGMAFVGRYSEGSYWLPKIGNHELVDKHSPVVVDSRELMFVWTHHNGQDTKTKTFHAKNSVSYKSFLNDYPPLSAKPRESGFFTLDNEIIEDVKSANAPIDMSDEVFSRDSSSFFSSQPSSRHIKYQVEYEIEEVEENGLFITDSLDSEKRQRAFLLSFCFSDSQDKIFGLTLSKNKDIGWYKYLNIERGVSRGEFSFALEVPSAVVKASLVRRFAKIGNFKIIKLKITSLGSCL